MIFAKVAEVGVNGLRLILPGESIPTQKYYNFLASYSPAVGDRVAVIKNGGTFLIIGKLQH